MKRKARSLFEVARNVRKATRKDIYYLKDYSVLEHLNRQLLDAAMKEQNVD